MNPRDTSLLVLLSLCVAAPAQPSLSWHRQVRPEPQSSFAMATNPGGKGVILFSWTTTWIYEGTTWRQVVVNVSPPGRAGHAMAYDMKRDRVVLFGGSYNGSLFYDDTWEWDGVGWTEIPSAVRPPARGDHAMAYDPSTTKVIMFGGANPGLVPNETWEWDGLNWTRNTAAPQPAVRRLHAMATDGQRGIVMHGGYVNSLIQHGDTWVRRGGTWAQMTPTLTPGIEYQHSMSYVANSTVIKYGGGTNTGMWSWNGVTWSQIGSTAPGGRLSHAAAFDFQGLRTILFGGYNGSGALGDTWEWNGTSWSPGAVAPAGRQNAAAAFDPISNRTIAHGGRGISAAARHADTWSWNGVSWQHVGTAGTLSRISHSLDWEPVRQQLVMFGGNNGTTQTQTTHVWDRTGNKWSALAPAASPPAREGHASASLAGGAQQGIVVFGGYGAVSYNDLWLWDGVTWSNVSATNAPGAPPLRGHAGMACEPGGASVLLFGGVYGTNSTLGDTWRFDIASRSWTQLNPLPAPSSRYGHKMLFDPARGKILLHGGYDGANVLADIWEWDTATSSWTAMAKAPMTARTLHVLTHGPRGELALFGGTDLGNTLADTWIATAYAAATFQSVGIGCGPASGTAPKLDTIGLPFLGHSFTLRLTGLPTSNAQVGFFLDVGLRAAPLDLCPSCTLRVDPAIVIAVPSVAGIAALQLTVPPVPGFVGATLACQGIATHPSYACSGLTLGLTNAGLCTIGAY